MKHCLFVLSCLFYCFSSYASEEMLHFGKFGNVHLYRVGTQPSHVALMISGSDGWNPTMVNLATELKTLDSLVVGIDMAHYLKEIDKASGEKCSYPAADFEALSQFVQKSLGFPSYRAPVLIGYLSGATLAYATLVQAPPGTFAGGISIGFCPDLSVSKPLCKGYGLEWKSLPSRIGYSFLPATNLKAPWFALQGAMDQVCRAAVTESFVRQTTKGEFVLVPKVGHDFSVKQNWMPQLKQAFVSLTQQHEIRNYTRQNPLAPPVKDLPLVEITAREDKTRAFAVIISGDGGWASLDRQIGETLAANGMSVVGLDSLRYFWTRRAPEGAANDLARILRHYLLEWKLENVILVGYSFGADVLPFLENRLPPDLQKKVRMTALLGPGLTADFEFHVTDWLGKGSTRTARPLLPEVENWKGPKVLCFYGADENESLCTTIRAKLLIPIRLSGGHHFNGDYQGIAEKIFKEAS